MKKFHKIAAAVMAVIMAISMVACSTGSSQKKIGIIQMMDHVALNGAREGFIAALEENGYKDGENIVITYQNGQGDTNNMSTIADKFVGDKMDLVLAIATPAAQAIAGKTAEIPIIATAVTDFAKAGLVNSNDEPGTNVSGTNDMNPISAQLDLMFQLVPDIQTVGFLYSSSEDNSRLQVDIAKSVLDAKGITYVERTVASTNDVQQATASIVSECDAIYIPTDNIFASSMPTVNAVVTESKTPVICGESGMVASGGLATLGVNYYNIGHQAGLMAIRVLEGEDISKMPVESSDDYDFFINGDVAAAIGIEIPEELQQYVVVAE